MLLLCDRGFFSYKLWKSVVSRGVHLLARLSKGMILKPIKQLSDGSYLAKIYANSYDRKKDRRGIIVRVIKYTLNDPQRVGHQEEHTLLTDLLDETKYPAWELIPGYHWRWEHELVFDEQKTHQDPPRASKPTHLRSETPTGVLQEIYALSLAHFVIRSLMFQAAQRASLDTDRLSFTGCFQILQCRLPECNSRTPQSFEAWCEGLLEEMSRERIEASPQPHQPARHQTENEKLVEETTRTPTPTSIEENLYGVSSYDYLNGIDPSPLPEGEGTYVSEVRQYSIHLFPSLPRRRTDTTSGVCFPGRPGADRRPAAGRRATCPAGGWALA